MVPYAWCMHSMFGVTYLITPGFYSNHKHQLSNDKAHTQLNVNIVPQTPQRPREGGGREGERDICRKLTSLDTQ